MKAVKGFPERCELQINRERVCWFPFISFVHNCFEGKNDFKNTVLSWKHLYLHSHWGKESCKPNCVVWWLSARCRYFRRQKQLQLNSSAQRPTPLWCGASIYPWSGPMKHTQEPQDTHALACPWCRLGYYSFLFTWAVCQGVIISYQNCKMVLSSEGTSNHLSYF